MVWVAYKHGQSIIITAIVFSLWFGMFLFSFTDTFAQSDENVTNQTNSENIVKLNETISIIDVEEKIVNVVNLENITVALNETLTIAGEIEEEEIEEEQNWVLILIAVEQPLGSQRRRRRQLRTTRSRRPWQ